MATPCMTFQDLYGVCFLINFKIMKNTLIIIVVAIALSACSKKEDPVVAGKSYSFGNTIVPSSIAPVLDSFLYAAEKRNKKIDLSALNEIVVGDIMLANDSVMINLENGLQTHITRAARYDSTTHKLYIASGSEEYKNEKEAMLFHMFGIIFLKRTLKPGYFNSRSSDYFDPISIMNDDFVPTYTGVYGYKREYYINELFDQNTIKPSWAN